MKVCKLILWLAFMVTLVTVFTTFLHAVFPGKRIEVIFDAEDGDQVVMSCPIYESGFDLLPPKLECYIKEIIPSDEIREPRVIRP